MIRAPSLVLTRSIHCRCVSTKSARSRPKSSAEWDGSPRWEPIRKQAPGPRPMEVLRTSRTGSSQPRPKSEESFRKSVGYLRRHNEDPLPSRRGSEIRNTAGQQKTQTVPERYRPRSPQHSFQRVRKEGDAEAPNKKQAFYTLHDDAPERPASRPRRSQFGRPPPFRMDSYALTSQLKELSQSLDDSDSQPGGDKGKGKGRAKSAEAVYAEGLRLADSVPKHVRRNSAVYSQLIRLALQANKPKEAMRLVLELKKNSLTPALSVFSNMFRGLATLDPPLDSNSELFLRARRLFEEFEEMRVVAFDSSSENLTPPEDPDYDGKTDATAVLRTESYRDVIQSMQVSLDRVANVLIGWAQLLSSVGHHNECVTLWDHLRAKTRFDERNDRRVLVHTPPYPHRVLFGGMLNLYAYVPSTAQNLSAAGAEPNLRAVTNPGAIKGIWDEWQSAISAAKASHDESALEDLAVDEFAIRKLVWAASNSPDPQDCLFVLDVLRDHMGLQILSMDASDRAGAREFARAQSAPIRITNWRTVRDITRYLHTVGHYAGALAVTMQLGFQRNSFERYPELNASHWQWMSGTVNNIVASIIKLPSGHAEAVYAWLEQSRLRRPPDLRTYEAAIRASGWSVDSAQWIYVRKVWSMLVEDWQAGKLGSKNDLLHSHDSRHHVSYGLLISAWFLCASLRAAQGPSENGRQSTYRPSESREENSQYAREALRMIHEFVSLDDGAKSILGSSDLVKHEGIPRPSPFRTPPFNPSAKPEARAQTMILWMTALLKDATRMALDTGPSGANLVTREEKDRWTLVAKQAREIWDRLVDADDPGVARRRHVAAAKTSESEHDVSSE